MGQHVGPFEVEVPIGGRTASVFVTATDGKHVYVELYRDDKAKGLPSLDKGWEVRGVRYFGSIHLHLWQNGCWEIGPEFKQQDGKMVPYPEYERKRNSVYLKRSDWMQKGYGHDGPSDSTEKIITVAIRHAVQDWARKHEAILWQAEENDITGRVEEQEKEVAQLVHQLAEAKLKLHSLREELARYTAGRTVR